MYVSHYRRIIVAAGGLLGCVAIGAMFSLPVFLPPIARDTGWSIYIGACCVGIGAFLIALTFKPFAELPTPQATRAAG